MPVAPPSSRARKVQTALRQAGCVAAEEETVELLAAAGGDDAVLEELVARRCAGEPLAWVVGEVRFCGERVLVQRGVYVPRQQTEALARAALGALPEGGVAVDLCTGAGALAVVLARGRLSARVVATDIDPAAVRCARANGVAAAECDMAAGLAPELTGTADVVTAVVPYVPTDALRFLPRDAVDHEPRHALHGGPDGTDQLVRAVAAAAALLRGGGALFLELGGDQADLLAPVLAGHGFDPADVLLDDDGDVRGLHTRRR
jgi:release factor glutamine methyltransferase